MPSTVAAQHVKSLSKNIRAIKRREREIITHIMRLVIWSVCKQIMKKPATLWRKKNWWTACNDQWNSLRQSSLQVKKVLEVQISVGAWPCIFFWLFLVRLNEFQRLHTYTHTNALTYNTWKKNYREATIADCKCITLHYPNFSNCVHSSSGNISWFIITALAITTTATTAICTHVNVMGMVDLNRIA